MADPQEVASKEEFNPSKQAESPDILAWQRRLLPFMAGMVVVLALAFFSLSVVSALQMRSFLTEDPKHSISDRVGQTLAASDQDPRKSVDVMQHGLLMLEADVLEKRYRQASAQLMSRIWTRQLAFNTGMVLALIGAVFIVGKLSESASKAGFEGSGMKANIDSTSPGLILAFMGVVLMAIALVVQPKIEVQDKAIYFVSSPKPKTGAPVSACNGSPASDPDPDPDPNPSPDSGSNAPKHEGKP